ncbi:putative peroxiredoxin Rv2521/MT2597 [Arthrobacter sp. Hiyo8]|nr:putative peroxiredoxin Rv2521/MT2597 [Arthrobacter sp. Hiyo8]
MAERLIPGDIARTSPSRTTRAARSAWPRTVAAIQSSTSTRGFHPGMRQAGLRLPRFPRNPPGAGYEVLGISPDTVKDLEKFVAEESLTFPLLSDEGHHVAEAYAAWGEKKNYGRTYQGLIRSTIVVDPTARWPWPSTTCGPPAMSPNSAGTSNSTSSHRIAA